MHIPSKIPVPLGILIVLFFVVGLGIAFEALSRGTARASISIEPKGIAFTNVTDAGFSVIWNTDGPASGLVTAAGPGGKKLTSFDERDFTGKIGKYTTHSVSVRNTTPETVYSITIVSNGKQFSGEGSGYRVKTGPALTEELGPFDPSYGVVRLPDGKQAEGAIVIVTLDGAQTLSTLVKPTGSWIIPLSGVRTEDLSHMLPFSDKLFETITVRLGDLETHALTDTFNDSPVPDMTLGQPYDFRNQQTRKPTAKQTADASVKTGPPQTAQPAVLGAQITNGVTQKNTTKIAITQPVNGSRLVSNLPLFQGLGIPGKSIVLTIGMKNPLTGTTSVLADGTWRYTAPKALASGKQSVTVITQDARGKTVALTHQFEIFKSGSQVLGQATPSATLEPTPSGTPSASPTAEMTPTPTTTVAGAPLPTSGSILPTLILIIMGIGLFGGGLAVSIRE